MGKLDLQWVSDVIGDDYLRWKNGDVIRIQAQTSTGKTEFIKTKLLQHAIENNKRILYICNRVNLKRQMKIDVAEKQTFSLKNILHDIELLDKLEVIGNITITSYQKIQHFLLNEKYELNYDDIYRKYLDSDYIVMDEVHYIVQDSSFANKTIFFYEDYLRQYNKDCITILISATMDYIKKPLETIYNDMELNIRDYTTGIDYSHINTFYFKSITDIIHTINNDNSGNKWLVFINNNNNAKNMLEEIKDSEFVCSERSKYANQMNREELNNLISNSQFNCKCLIATKAIDNGVNIHDPLVKNIVITALDKIDFIQMLGRKRIDINNPQEINLYIMARYRKSFSTLINRKYDPADSIVKLWTNKRNEFNRKYDVDIDKLGKYSNLFYKDKNGNWQLNEIGYLMLIKHKEFCEDMIDKFDKQGESAFIREQLRWMKLKFKKENWIEEVLDNNIINTLEEYLEERVNIKLFDNEQQKLKEFITKDFDSMIDKLQNRHKGREPGLKILNKLLIVCDIPYSIISKQEKNAKSNNFNKTYWLIINSKVDESKKCHTINIY